MPTAHEWYVHEPEHALCASFISPNRQILPHHFITTSRYYSVSTTPFLCAYSHPTLPVTILILIAYACLYPVVFTTPTPFFCCHDTRPRFSNIRHQIVFFSTRI